MFSNLTVMHKFFGVEYHGMSGMKATQYQIFGGTLMCNNGWGNNCCWWIIILLILFCGCGNNGLLGNNNGCGCCDNNNCGCC